MGWLMKISRALVHRYLISYSWSWTGLPGRLPRTVNSVKDSQQNVCDEREVDAREEEKMEGRGRTKKSGLMTIAVVPRCPPLINRPPPFVADQSLSTAAQHPSRLPSSPTQARKAPERKVVCQLTFQQSVDDRVEIDLCRRVRHGLVRLQGLLEDVQVPWSDVCGVLEGDLGD